MEQKVKDKMDVATKAIQKMEQDINSRWKVFRSEFYTSEIEQMIKTIVDYSRCVYTYKLSDDRKVWINPCNKVIQIVNERNETISNLYISFELCNCKKYDDTEIRIIEAHAKDVKKANRYLDLLYQNAEKIIEDITQKYIDVTETHSSKMDEVLQMLSVPYEPTKHIKVTVEWL